jgi:hypothetical protein
MARPFPFPDWVLYTLVVGGIVLTWRDLRFGLAAIAIAIGISPEYQTEMIRNLRLEDFVMGTVFLAWLLRKVSRRESLLPFTPLNHLWFFWLLTGGLAVIFGLALGTLPSIWTGLFYWLKRLELALLFWVVADCVRSKSDVQWLATVGMMGAVLSAAIGWHQKWLNPPRENVNWNAYKVSGPPGEKNNVFAQYLVFNGLVALALGFSLYPSQAAWLPFALAGFIVVPILFSFSRSSMASLTLGGIALTGVFYRRWLPLLLVAYFLLPVLIPSVVQRRLEQLSWERFKVERLGGYFHALEDTLANNPLTGHGLGFRGFNAYENQYANTLAQEGFLGLLAFLALLWGALCMLREALKATTNSYLRGILQGCFAGMIAYAIAGLSGVPLLAIRPSETFWLWMGLCAGIWRITVVDGEEEAIDEMSEPEAVSVR